MLRLKASYGVNGTQPGNYNDWRSLARYDNPCMERPGGGLYNIGNDKLTWESNYTTNIGVDFGLLERIM
jgi:hypothetical protein